MIIITLAIFAMITLLLCVGAGVYGYVLFQRNFSRVLVQAPVDVQKITTEITDIDLPPQFTPIMGSAIFGMKSVNYAWNPKGVPLTMTTWNQSQGSERAMLQLMEMAVESPVVTDDDFKVPSYQKKMLKSQYAEYTENVQEFTIRGRKCQFLFVTGRPHEGAFDDEMMHDETDEEEMMEEEQATNPTAPTDASNQPADATAPSEPTTTVSSEEAVKAGVEAPKPTPSKTESLPPVRAVSGQFPGKSGSTTITIRVPAEGTDDDLLLKIIQSIH